MLARLKWADESQGRASVGSRPAGPAGWSRQCLGGTDIATERRLADLESSLAQVKLEPNENAATPAS
jgi:hypothetical protein